MTLGVIDLYGRHSIMLYLLLTSTEIIVLKVTYMYKFSTIAIVDEHFLKNILILWNIAMIGVYILILVTLREYETSSNPYLSCFRTQNPLDQLLVRTVEQDNAEL